jgi:hypothetical protein
MIQNDDLHIQMLMNLGLTLLQAKVYLTLAELGKAEVKRIPDNKRNHQSYSQILNDIFPHFALMILPLFSAQL